MKNLPDVRAIQCFLAVAREGNVTRAADVLHLTQPAVSQQIKHLAQASGLVLFRRNARGLDLTPAGSILARKGEQVLLALREFRQTARDTAGEVGGVLRIGTILDPDATRLGSFLDTLVKRAPALHTELSHGTSGNVPERIGRDELDAGYYIGDINAGVSATRTGRDDGAALFHRMELARFSYWVIAPPGWESRVAGRGWDALAALPWIGTPPQSAHNRLLTPVFDALGVRQNVISVVDQESSMLAMVRSGVGLSLCRASVALGERQVRGIAIADAVELPTTLEFVCLDTRRHDPAITIAFETLQQVWGAWKATGIPAGARNIG